MCNMFDQYFLEFKVIVVKLNAVKMYGVLLFVKLTNKNLEGF